MARISKVNFTNNEVVNYNLSEIYSCMKVCHHRDIDADELGDFAWKYFRNEILEKKMSMREVDCFCTKLNENFHTYFSYKLR